MLPGSDDFLAHFLRVGPLVCVEQRVACPGHIHPCKQPESAALRYHEAVVRPDVVLRSPRKEFRRLPELCLYEPVDGLRIFLSECGRMKPGLGRSRKQGNILPVAHEFEIHQRPDDPGLGYIHVYYRLVVLRNTAAGRCDLLHEIVGVVYGVIGISPCILHP